MDWQAEVVNGSSSLTVLTGSDVEALGIFEIQSLHSLHSRLEIRRRGH